MELQFDASVNKAHERYQEGQRKKVVAQKKKKDWEQEAKYTARRIMVGVLGTAAIIGLIQGIGLIDEKLADNVYRVYGDPTGTMAHPFTHQLVKYWQIDESGKKYYMEDLKGKALFEKLKFNDKEELVTNRTPHEGDLMGETRPLGGK